MLHLAVEHAFDELLRSWRCHWRMRRTRGVPVEELAESRRRLDVARDRMHRLRLAVHPEGDELESVVESVWCESLDSIVHLRWLDRDAVRPGNFRCACGHLVPIDWNHVADPASGEAIPP